MNNIYYLCRQIDGSNYPLTKEIRSPFCLHFDRNNKISGLMKEIKLPKNKIVLVDDDNYDYLNQWKWHESGGTIKRRGCRNSKPQNIKMVREILNVPVGMEVDHIDRNIYNNQKSNLRICTHRQNSMNRFPSKRIIIKGIRVSTYKGKKGITRRIIARINVNGKEKYLGTFDTEIDAGKAYNEAAKIYHGEFAALNIL